VDKAQLFKDGVINQITKCIVGYKSNPTTTYVVDGLVSETPQGVGPGEVLMITLSSSITKMKGKGDLMVNHPVDGEVELKTTKQKDPRFYDRSVKADNTYDQKSANFIAKHVPAEKGIKFPASGMNMRVVMQAFEVADDKNSFIKDLRGITDSIFPKAEPDTKGAIIDGVTSLSYEQASQAYAKASFQNYKAHKKFKGVLYMNIKAGTTLYYNDWDDITKAGGSVKPGTIYFVGANSSEGPYPQIGLALPI